MGEKLKAITELRSGGDRPNFDAAFAFWNADIFAGDFLFGLAFDTATVPINGNGVSNADTVYQFDGDAAHDCGGAGVQRRRIPAGLGPSGTPSERDLGPAPGLRRYQCSGSDPAQPG